MQHNASSIRRVRAGFTLIELLVVIAIISLLVSILLPSLTKAKELAQAVVCANNIRNLGSANIQYASDNNGSFTKRYPYDPARKSPWFNLLYNSVDHKFMQTYLGFGCKTSQLNQPGHMLDCPNHEAYPASPDYYIEDYCYNLQCAPDFSKHLTMDDFTRPARTTMFLDGHMFETDFNNWDNFGGTEWWGAGGGWLAGVRRIAFPHNERTNIVFIDGHVSPSAFEEMTDDWFKK